MATTMTSSPVLRASGEGNDSVLVMDVESIHVVAAQGGLIPTEADQVLGEAEVVHHFLVGCHYSGRPSRGDSKSANPKSTACLPGIPVP